MTTENPSVPTPEENLLDQNKQFKDVICKQQDTLKDIISFLEYEEAYTVDTRSQQRIRKKLKELKVWN